MIMRGKYYGFGIRRSSFDERGLSLLEVLLSTVVMGVALTGFLMALSTASSTTKIATDQNELVYFSQQEFEALRSLPFEEVPSAETSTPGYVEKIPDYYRDLAISQQMGGDCFVMASGDLVSVSTYSRDFAFDGKRAESNKRWMGSTNALAYNPGGGGPGAGGPGGGGPGGGGGPDAGGPGGDPGAGGEFAPPEYQYIYCAFPKKVEISRILFDNRFNVTESPIALTGDLDYLPHDKDIWQKNYTFFYSDKVLGEGEIYNPWSVQPEPLKLIKDQGYGSTGIEILYDDPENPLEAGIIGVHNIDTYSDFDINFHYPYVSEIEVYGYTQATNYVEEYVAPDGEVQYDNVIMYFPNYMGSDFDMGRRCYITVSSLEEAKVAKRDLVNVEVEFFPANAANKNTEWQKTTWWDKRTKPLARFQTQIYRGGGNRVDKLPNLHDFPTHLVYGDNEDLSFPYTVPGAKSIRVHFVEFDLEPNPGSDEVTIEDPEGNIYSVPPIGNVGFGNNFKDQWTEWVPGDTIIIHFKSNGSLNSFDSFYKGFQVDSVEVGGIELEEL